MKLTLFPESSYRLSLFPIIGEESNALIDDEGFDTDVLSELEEKYIEQTERQYDIMFDFYASGNGMYYSIDDGDQDELEDNVLPIDSKYSLDVNEIEPDEDFQLVEDMQMVEDCGNSDSEEIFNDVKNLHNDEEGGYDIVVEAIRRRMKQVAHQLVEKGIVDDEDSVRFALQYGPIYGCQYSFDINADEFDPEALRPIDCTDWNDCHVSDVLQEHWPDRLVGSLIYNGIFYAGECENIDCFEWNCDLVDSDLNSLL